MNISHKTFGVGLLTATLLLSPVLGIAASASAAATTPLAGYDGVYSGTTHLVTGNPSQCQPDGLVTVNVTQGRFHYAWHPGQDAVVRIGANGGYSAMLAGSFASHDKHMLVLPRMDGRADGHALTGTFGTRWCTYSYRFDGARVRS